MDASASAVPSPTGVGLMIRNLVRTLRARGDLRLEVLYRLSRLKRRRYFLPGARVFHERFSLLLARGLDVFHGPDTRLPRFGGPALVATLHDFSAARPEFASARFRATREGHWADVAARADVVVTYSEAVRREVHERLSIPLERIAVGPLAPTAQVVASDPAAVAAARARHAGGDPYVLVLGELSARKNTLNALRAFAASELSDHRLLLVGPTGYGVEGLEEEVARLGLEERVVRPDYLPADEVAALVHGAALFFFPTRYEGFGMPLLEAFGAGVPVVIGSAETVREVAGGAAAEADSEDPTDLARALSEVGRDAERRAELVRLGRERLKRYSWERTGERLAAVYRAAAAREPLPAWLQGGVDAEEATCSR